MKSLFAFLKATVLGGIVFLVPIVVTVLVLGKALQLSVRIAGPMARVLPIDSVAGIALADFVGLLLIMILCFLAGLAARSAVARNIVRRAEDRLLWNIPGYTLIKGITEGLGATRESATLQPVLAKLDDAAQIAFEIERLPDGRVVVFVPGTPDLWSGDVMLMVEERVELLPTTAVAVAQTLRRYGRGMSEIMARR